MNKIGIIYFSGTGNTKFIAQTIKEELEKHNINSDLINIEKDKINLDNYKSIIIGGPVYVERYPEILLKYVENNLKKYKGRCMLFSTQANRNATVTFQNFINKFPHLNVTYCMFIPMPNNFYNFFSKKMSKEEEIKLIKNAILKVRKEIKEFLNGKINLYPKKNINVKMVDSVYNMVYPYYARYLNNRINIDNDKCIHCKICEKNCPVKSIKITDKAKFDNNCTLCQRCLSKCPKNAFIYKKKEIEQYNPNFRIAKKQIDEKIQ